LYLRHTMIKNEHESSFHLGEVMAENQHVLSYLLQAGDMIFSRITSMRYILSKGGCLPNKLTSFQFLYTRASSHILLRWWNLTYAITIITASLGIADSSTNDKYMFNSTQSTGDAFPMLVLTVWHANVSFGLRSQFFLFYQRCPMILLTFSYAHNIFGIVLCHQKIQILFSLYHTVS
jgi:hypothetical protein